MAVDNSKRIIHGHFLDVRPVDHLSTHALNWVQASFYLVLSTSDQRQGRTLHSIGAARMGLRLCLPKLAGAFAHAH
jgi:hypothetical protein